ncbi:MAG: UDP-2,3-diacylglucosamine diphosphatase, partial [Pseudomonadota bacterium]
LRAYADHTFGNISVVREAIHENADGKRLLVIHGDQFDAAVVSSKWIGTLGGQAYALLLKINGWVNTYRKLTGRPYWSLAKYLKHKVKNAVQAISNYEQAVVESARRHGVDGVVCGHIHRPEINHFDDVVYCNCGDWVESCTALVENKDGSLALLDWTEAESIAEPLPKAA